MSKRLLAHYFVVEKVFAGVVRYKRIEFNIF